MDDHHARRATTALEGIDRSLKQIAVELATLRVYHGSLDELASEVVGIAAAVAADRSGLRGDAKREALERATASAQETVEWRRREAREHGGAEEEAAFLKDELNKARNGLGVVYGGAVQAFTKDLSAQ